MSMTATARLVDGLRHEVDVNGRHTIVTDEPTALGGSDMGPAPHELLAATLAACISTMIAMYASRKGWKLGELVVEVDYDANAVPRHFDVCVQLSDDLSAEQVTRLRRVADTCPVRRALEVGFTFDESLVTRDRAQRSERESQKAGYDDRLGDHRSSAPPRPEPLPAQLRV